MDRFDCRLLGLLQQDASRSNADLATEIGLSSSQISRRRVRLEQSGVIERYIAKVSAPAVGLQMDVFIRVTLTAHSADTASEFSRFLSTLPELRSAYSLTGDADYLLHAKVRDLASLSELVSQQLLPHKNVREVRSEIALQTIVEDSPLPIVAG
ncbi:MAG: Lrp/AsnC family transcriptional regulator [Gammaproteobacteria bacterium]|nr:Lrp/AsnC family transcriptional regulator [Gammaproteobacteria bacterium]